MRKRPPAAPADPQSPHPEDEPGRDPGATDDLVRRAKENPDDPSWHDLFDKVERFVRREFGSKVPAGITVDDLIAEVMLRLLKSLSGYEEREGKAFWSWMRPLVQHALIDLIRRTPERQQSLEGLAGSSSSVPVPDEEPSVSRVARGREVHAAFLQCLGRLDAKKAKVLELRLLLSLSHRDIAQQLGYNREVTVAAVVLRGRRQIERCMRAKGFGDSISL